MLKVTESAIERIKKEQEDMSLDVDDYYLRVYMAAG